MSGRGSGLKPNKKGEARIGGRAKGTPNKVTREVKDAIAQVFEDIGGIATFASWARYNKTEFYKLYGKLLPIQLQGSGSKGEFIIQISEAESKL